MVGELMKPRHTSGTINVRNLQLLTSVVPDAWGRTGKVQPTSVSVTLDKEDMLVSAAGSDDCALTTSYSDVAKLVLSIYEKNSTEGSLGLASDAGSPLEQCHLEISQMRSVWHCHAVTMETIFPKGLLRGVGGWGLRTVTSTGGLEAWFVVRGLRLGCIIGVNQHEREQKQDIVINLEAQLHKVLSCSGTLEILEDMRRLVDVSVPNL